MLSLLERAAREGELDQGKQRSWSRRQLDEPIGASCCTTPSFGGLRTSIFRQRMHPLGSIAVACLSSSASRSALAPSFTLMGI